MKNKIGAVNGGTLVLIVLACVAAYMFIPAVQDIFKPSVDDEVVGRCPSSGLTEVTLNTQEALASSATNAEVNYYIYDDSVMVKEGSTTLGTVSFDIECGVGREYTMLVINETTSHGFYPTTVTVDATGATDTHNLKLYQYGEIGIGSIVSSADPTGGVNISGGAGKTCGFTITFANNESASGFNNPLILCQVNSTAITDISMTGATEVSAKRPARIGPTTGMMYYTFEYPGMIKSTDAGIKVSGKIQFSASATFSDAVTNNMSCIIADQTKYQVAEYKTLSLTDGFITAAEDETIADIGAPDSNVVAVVFRNSSYC